MNLIDWIDAHPQTPYKASFARKLPRTVQVQSTDAALFKLADFLVVLTLADGGVLMVPRVKEDK